MMEMRHPTHRHRLILSEENIDIICDICSKPASSPYYACTKCQFYLHKTCAELPQQINHPFHPQHSLHLRNQANYTCDSCYKDFKVSPSYQCKTCDFDLHVECALMPAITPEGDDYIQHFSHQHPLTLYNKDENPSPRCFLCKTNSSDPIYGCTTCDYFLHKSCTELPKNILHALHPSEALILSLGFGNCNYCHNRDYGFKYKCNQHGFCLDAMCTLMPLSEEEGEKQKGPCLICDINQSNENHFCIPSKYYLNKSCALLPEFLDHPFHSHKPLQLSPSKQFYCDSCHKYFHDSPSLSCDEHKFHMDIRCALMPPVECQREDHIQHLSHQHPLTLHSQLESSVDCFACNKSFASASLIYACLQCDYFLHDSCAQLFGQLSHPLHNHTDHSLTLRMNHSVYSCSCCQVSDRGFILRCDLCDFNIGIECLPLKPTIDFKYHQHQLCYIEGVNFSNFACNSCHTSCKLFTSSVEINLTEPYFFRCVECNFNLHLLCGPLPCTIKHKCHIHGLTLKDSVIDDDTDEFYCDVCEEERDPRLCVYHCEDCGFVSHVHCVINEVISALRNDAEEVEKRIVGDWRIEEEMENKSVPSGSETDSDMSEDELELKFLTLMDLINSIANEERLTVESFFETKLVAERNGEENDIELSESKEEADDILALSFYNEDYLDEFGSKIESYTKKRKYLIESGECQLEVVKMEGYIIPSYLAPILKILFHKYGKFKSRSSLGRKAKSIVLYLICWAINDAARTCLYDITEEQLSKWVQCIDGAKEAGFDLDLIEDCFIKVLKTYLALQSNKQEEEIPLKLDQKIEELNEEISQLTTKVEEVQQSRERYLAYVKGEKSEELQELLIEGRANKWKTMRDVFLS